MDKDANALINPAMEVGGRVCEGELMASLIRLELGIELAGKFLAGAAGFVSGVFDPGKYFLL